jgi:hypothetical protein
MRQILLVLLFASLSLLFSCGESMGDKTILPSSTGKYGEVLVIVDTLYENGATGEELKSIFFKAMPGLPQQESQFRMASVAPQSFKSILKRSRNILKLNIGNGKKTAIKLEEDIWAKDQLMIHITASSDENAARVLEKNRQTIRDYFNEREVERLKKQFSIKPQIALMEELEKNDHVRLIIPPGFVKMSCESNGCWFKKEKSIGEHQIIQGIMLYSYPYESDSVFALSEMIDKRDVFTLPNVQGSRDSSFMIVYEEYVPTTKEINLNGLYALEYRGLWNMQNDFMGGPFLHYTFVDEKRNKVINLDGFVYAPKFNKREYLRELEAIMKTARIVND